VGAPRRGPALGAGDPLRLSGLRSPLATWFAGPGALRAFRARRLGRAPVVLAPRDRAWRTVAPGFAGCVALARAGVPFQIVAARRYDRRGDPRRLRRALAAGATVFCPQAHEVLPRVARLMAALRAELLGPLREECSFLFMVEGRGREGMGLHHDDAVDAFWLQLEGRRTVTIGPPVAPGTPPDLDDALARRGGRGWRTFDLPPGSLFYLPPRTPHRVICRGRSLALSLTWARAGRRPASARRAARSLARFPVAAGQAVPIPPASRTRLWTQVPAAVEAGRGTPVIVHTTGGRVTLPAGARRLAEALAGMPSLPRAAARGRDREAVRVLLAHGLLGPRDLPIAIHPAAPAALDGWRFA